MASLGMQMLASSLCLLGWVGVIICCIVPMWRVTAFVGSTIVTSQTIWEGIWKTCVVQSTGQIMCKPYTSMLNLSADLQAARGLLVLAIGTGAVGLVLAFIGGKCTRFLDEAEGGAKAKVAVAAGAILIATGIICLIPTVVTAGIVVRKFYSASNDSQRRELGASLYIGWGSSVLLILGGGMFISANCPLKAHDEDRSPSVRYLVVRSSNGSSREASQRIGAQSARSQNTQPAFTGSQNFEGTSINKTPSRGQLFSEGGSVGSKAPSTKSQMKRPGSTRSEQSEAPSTKSQMKRPESVKSEQSEAPSTKSQLERAASAGSLAESVKSQTSEEALSQSARTYI